MENTNANKEKFFAAHWGQRVWMRTHGNGEQVRLYINADTMEAKKGNINTDHLLLTSLKDIKDEDAITIITMFNPDFNPDYIFTLEGKEDKEYFIATIMGDIDEHFDERYKPIVYFEMLDHLRSKGYLFPFMGLSTEEIIARGWAKTKE